MLAGLHFAAGTAHNLSLIHISPGQRHGRVNDMAVHNDLGMGAEHPHHTADGRADFAGSMVMDAVSYTHLTAFWPW